MYLSYHVLLVLSVAFIGTISSTLLKEEHHVGNSTDWDYFMLVQRWPQSSCQIVNASGHPCRIPSDVKGWTIHGLWPSGYDSYPQHCHNWTFEMNQVMDLKDEMLLKWPNLYINRTFDSLWKHEYEKHGTCAASVHGFEKEHDYFVKTLDMAYKFDIQRLLEDHGIFPRAEGYQASLLNDIIHTSYKKTRCLWCGHVQGVGQVLSQSYVCVDKSLQMINCPSCEKQCVESMPVLYQPLHYDNDMTI